MAWKVIIIFGIKTDEKEQVYGSDKKLKKEVVKSSFNSAPSLCS